MNKRFTILFLIFFIVGMCCGCVSAGHTFHKGKYSVTVSDSQYNKVQYVKKHKYDDYLNCYSYFKVKTKHKVTVKVPKYKKKKVTKYKWKKKYILLSKSFYKNGMYHNKYYSTVARYYDNGWKFDCYASEENSYGGYNEYALIKKKVSYTDTKKVKNGYKKVKMPVYGVFTVYSATRSLDDEGYDWYTVNIPQLQFVAMKKGCPNQYLTNHYNL